MDKESEKQDDQNEDLVIIEQKDSRARVYIIIATLLGLAAGGLVGAAVTKADWQKKYQSLNTQYQQVLSQVEQHQSNLDRQKQQLEADEQLKRRKLLHDTLETHQLELHKLQAQINTLTTNNQLLKQQLADNAQNLAAEREQNSQLTRQNDMQTSMFGQSQQLFKRETELKAEVAKLNKEKSTLEQNQSKLKQQCDLYLDGTSWDARSDSCERFDDLTARLSQINQMLQVHNMDLKHIESLKQEIGL